MYGLDFRNKPDVMARMWSSIEDLTGSYDAYQMALVWWDLQHLEEEIAGMIPLDWPTA